MAETLVCGVNDGIVNVVLKSEVLTLTVLLPLTV